MPDVIDLGESEGRVETEHACVVSALRRLAERLANAPPEKLREALVVVASQSRFTSPLTRRTFLVAAANAMTILAMGSFARAENAAIGPDIEVWDAALAGVGVVDLVTLALRLGSAGKVLFEWLEYVVAGKEVYDYGASFVESGNKTREAAELLSELTYSDGPYALRAAAEHPYKSPAAVMGLADFTGRSWYPLEVACCAAYAKRFQPPEGVSLQHSGLLQLMPDENVILFGSQVSNVVTRLIFGNPFMGAERFDVPVKCAALHRRGIVEDRWKARVRWNLHSRGSDTIERTQFGDRWVTRDHYIADDHTHQTFTPVSGADGVKINDYLLLTRLPRRRSCRGPTITIFAGVHGAGTLASLKLLGDAPLSELEKVRDAVRGQRFYQALFEAKVGAAKVPWSSTHEQVAQSIRCLDASPIIIERAELGTYGTMSEGP
jgi:hypothetical protein